VSRTAKRLGCLEKSLVRAVLQDALLWVYDMNEHILNIREKGQASFGELFHKVHGTKAESTDMFVYIIDYTVSVVVPSMLEKTKLHRYGLICADSVIRAKLCRFTSVLANLLASKDLQNSRLRCKQIKEIS